MRKKKDNTPKAPKQIKFKLDPADQAVLQDFQLVINHNQAAMGRFLGHIGVKKHGLIAGDPYKFDPLWAEGTVVVTPVPAAPAPPVALEK